MLVAPPVAGVFLVINMNKTEIITPTVTTEVPPIPMPRRADRMPDVIPEIVGNQATYVQLGSYKTAALARKGIQELATLKSKLYNVLDIRVYKVTLDNGTWYRLALKVADLKTGNVLCTKLKEVDQGCLVLQF